MKRWAGLLALFLLAAVGTVVLAPRFQPSEFERRHATIRAGMTVDEVEAIMGGRGYVEYPAPNAAQCWICPRRAGRPAVLLTVVFDEEARVVETAVKEFP
jgi:hypothetical protein